MAFSRKLRDRLKSGLHGLFVRGQSLGFDILPRHFYSSIPDVGELRRGETWRHASAMVGIDGTDIGQQLAFARACCTDLLRERLRRGGIFEHACQENGEAGYGRIEAEFLYCFIATKRPRRILQIGSGVSTAVILLAAQESGYQPEIVCIDPFPTDYLVRADRQKLIRLIVESAHEADLKVFTDLAAGDLLFVDSTHAVRPGGEVNRIILEVLPRLAPGTFAHFHDITFPYDYQPGVLNTLFFPAENTLLQAFLVNNPKCSIAVSLSMLHHACPGELVQLLPHYRPVEMNFGLHAGNPTTGDFPSSTYLSFR